MEVFTEPPIMEMEVNTTSVQDETLLAVQSIELLLLANDANEVEDDDRPVHLGDPRFYRDEENPPEIDIQNGDTVSLPEAESSASEDKIMGVQPEEVARNQARAQEEEEARGEAPTEEGAVVVTEPEIIDLSDEDSELAKATSGIEQVDNYYELCEVVMREVMSVHIPNILYERITEPLTPPPVEELQYQLVEHYH